MLHDILEYIDVHGLTATSALAMEAYAAYEQGELHRAREMADQACRLDAHFEGILDEILGDVSEVA
jgi:hypothetical protein